jgi:hypothetical protein
MVATEGGRAFRGRPCIGHQAEEREIKRNPTAWSRALVNTRTTMKMMQTGPTPTAQVLTDEERQKWTNK